MRRDDSDRQLLPAVLITVGLLWLLVQVGFVPAGLVNTLARWWPLFLVAAGLDLIVPGSRPAKLPFVAIAAAIVLLLALFAPATSTSTSTNREYDEPLSEDTQSVTADVVTAGSTTTITTTTDPLSLVEATFAGEPAGRVSTSGERDAQVEILPLRGAFSLPFGPRGQWNIGLPASVPLSLSVDGASGPLTLELARAELRSLELESGSGRVRARLPGNGASYSVDLDGGSGRVAVDVPPGASVDMDAEFGSGGSDIFIGEGSDLRLELRTGSGPVVLDLPDSAPIRLEVRDDGSGRLRLPGFLTRRSGDGDTGIWESPSLGNGGRVIDVRVTATGSGPITIR
ncbi:MAG TPA: hypothetical protein VFD39_07715 [Trueperaceae bacterium]|nr:hypothetical protein [Trueperaceae bacterium]